MIRFAFARPRSISTPEWPPRRPQSLTSNATPSVSINETGMRQTVLFPPAQLTVITPSASESMFSSLCPFSIDRSIADAPSMPTSSDTVNTASSLGCATSGESRIAST